MSFVDAFLIDLCIERTGLMISGARLKRAWDLWTRRQGVYISWEDVKPQLKARGFSTRKGRSAWHGLAFSPAAREALRVPRAKRGPP